MVLLLVVVAALMLVVLELVLVSQRNLHPLLLHEYPSELTGFPKCIVDRFHFPPWGCATGIFAVLFYVFVEHWIKQASKHLCVCVCVCVCLCLNWIRPYPWDQ